MKTPCIRLFLLLLLSSSTFYTTTADDNPIKVFIISGQSNALGQGRIVHLNALVADPACCNEFRDTLMENGAYKTLPNVYMDFFNTRGLLQMGSARYTGGGKFGPEMMLGYTLNQAINEPILIIKVAFGGSYLSREFRPPSSGLGEACGYSTSDIGGRYRTLVSQVTSTLADISSIIPGATVGNYELAGLFWFQGWNDHLEWTSVYEYEDNLANLIRDWRSDLGAPDMKVVVGEFGQHGVIDETQTRKFDLRVKALRMAQERVTLQEEFRNNTLFVRTAPLVVKGDVQYDDLYHYYGRADNFYRIGKALGSGMLELMNITVPDDYSCTC